MLSDYQFVRTLEENWVEEPFHLLRVGFDQVRYHASVIGRPGGPVRPERVLPSCVHPDEVVGLVGQGVFLELDKSCPGYVLWGLDLIPERKPIEEGGAGAPLFLCCLVHFGQVKTHKQLGIEGN